jgi:predicted HTH transcriptional regulator
MRQRNLRRLQNRKGKKEELKLLEITGGSSRTALRELRRLADLGILVKMGDTGQAAHYVIAKAKPVIGKQRENRS